MALDHALLDLVSAGDERAYLRTYGWTVPTLSLGYFQNLARTRTELRWRGAPVVRRPTGGGAIWHHHEVTYALIVPACHRLAKSSQLLYRGVHTAIAAALHTQGLEAHLRAGQNAVAAVSKTGSRPFLCFADSDPEDLVISGRKVVGSAQRRRRGAVLQHGSILLKHTPQTDELRGICDLADVPSDPSSWTDLLLHEIPQALGLSPLACDPTWQEAIRRLATELEQKLYKSEAWTARR
jgi:lipoate-protein ligase A